MDIRIAILYAVIAVLVFALLEHRKKLVRAIDLGAATFMYMQEVCGHTVGPHEVAMWAKRYKEEKETNGHEA